MAFCIGETAEMPQPDFLSQAGTNNRWSRAIRPPVLLREDSTNAPGTALSWIRIQPGLEISGIRLGMTKEEVLRVWGRPQGTSPGFWYAGHTAVTLVYADDSGAFRPEAHAHALFDSDNRRVAAIWVVFERWHEKPPCSPRAEECLRFFGEPALRNYIPDPLDPPKERPKHWYCRMVYKHHLLVLYFADGQLMALEANPRAKGVAPEGQGTDDLSVPFCLE